jgi:hypothetical protein
MLQITLTSKALGSFIKDLRTNKIAFQGQVRNTLFFLEDSPKLQMAIQLAKGRFGSPAIKVTHLS